VSSAKVVSSAKATRVARVTRASRRVVLVGAGHAHLHALRHAREYTERGAELVLVGPSPLWYSGLATGVLGGMYPPELDQIPASAWAIRGGGRHIAAVVERIDPAANRLHLSDGSAVDYDMASFAIGSEVAPLETRDGAPPLYGVKPISRLHDLKIELERRFGRAEAPRVLVAGGGASGCEVAASISALAARRSARVRIALVGSAQRLLPQASPAAAARLHQHLVAAGVEVRTSARVVRLEAGGARLAASAGAAEPARSRGAALASDGTPGEGLVAADIVVAATGLRPPGIFTAAGLATASDGALLVDATLRSTSRSSIFAAGDCAALRSGPLPRIGVCAIRQAPVLHDNLLAALDGATPARFRPQRRYLLILNLGDCRGLAMRGRLHLYGRSAQWLKDRIDRRFLRRHALPDDA
jgi:NADH dehydrogenase FAD-containing subunit